MNKADFYVGMGPEADWIGSVSKCGNVYELSTPILLQVNRIMFEELSIEYIKFCEGVVANHICQWPWQWPDSRMTDFSYIFLPQMEKVYVSIQGGDLLDPIMLVQGESLIEANAMLGPPVFPSMVEQVCFEDMETHGQTFTRAL